MCVSVRGATSLALSILCLSLLVSAQNDPPPAPANGGDFSTAVNPPDKVPTGVILVKGAWASASDSVTPVPEGGRVADNIYNNDYLGLRYSFPAGWSQKFEGPPPSDSGHYVLAQLRPTASKGAVRGSVLIMAQDMFFGPQRADNTLQLIRYMKDSLQPDYKVEIPLMPTKIAGRPFTFFAYWSPVAELHWYVLATQIRCHAVEIVLTSQNTKLLASLMLDLNKMSLPDEASPTGGTGGGNFPVCIRDYARSENVLARVDPVLTQSRFNPIPVRIIIDKTGKVKHVHFLSAFPDQAKAIGDALKQWKFKPYLQNGRPVEVETGIMFGRSQPISQPAASASVD